MRLYTTRIHRLMHRWMNNFAHVNVNSAGKHDRRRPFSGYPWNTHSTKWTIWMQRLTATTLTVSWKPTHSLMSFPRRRNQCLPSNMSPRCHRHYQQQYHTKNQSNHKRHHHQQQLQLHYRLHLYQHNHNHQHLLLLLNNNNNKPWIAAIVVFPMAWRLCIWMLGNSQRQRLEILLKKLRLNIAKYVCTQ